ncbi:hypothetical protein [Paenibacillus ginsengihumi]|jgi:hypothetical protein|uniref:hypothetical protein n=1 Tax=Paenibacillus ginsengihumi TaxID=431596 RepID=UPI0012ECAFD5|nr:hypothetical protein [Paenibacillus ginsengihumi]
MMTENCELCFKRIDGKPVLHVAGFPEREHRFCTARCRDRFLRMEDDELEYGDLLPKRDNKGKDEG